ncbi:MAG: hypothetical protein ACFFDI_22940 [Promethearchaeota archaeon]
MESPTEDYSNLISFKNSFKKTVLIIFFIIISIVFLTMNELLFKLFNLFYLPFVVIHELGHFVAAIILAPNSNPKIIIDIPNAVYRVTYDPISDGWKEIVILSSGVILSALAATIGFILLKKNDLWIARVIKYYLLSVITGQIGYLIPIHPIYAAGFAGDGFLIYLRLHYLFETLFPMTNGVFLLLFYCSLPLLILTFYLIGLIFITIFQQIEIWFNYPRKKSDESRLDR